MGVHQGRFYSFVNGMRRILTYMTCGVLAAKRFRNTAEPYLVSEGCRYKRKIDGLNEMLEEEDARFEEILEAAELTEGQESIIRESRVQISNKLHLSLDDYVCDADTRELLRTLFPRQLVNIGIDTDLDGEAPNSRAIMWGPPGSGKSYAFNCILGEIARIINGKEEFCSYAPVLALSTKAGRCE